jgi:phospholipase C
MRMRALLILVLSGLAAGLPAATLATKTPIKHIVVIFDENISFDHYFGTYPIATKNNDGSTYFGTPKNGTPAINGYTPTLITNNPNRRTGSNGQILGANPFRLDRSQADTCNNNNSYTTGQEAFDGGLLDNYALTSATPCKPPSPPSPPSPLFLPFLSMGYYDGNTVTALWNYAQNYAMSDNFFDTEFGGTVAGHMNLLSGQTNGLNVLTGTYASPVTAPSPNVPGTIVNGSIIANVNPFYDDCGGSQSPPTGLLYMPPYVAMTGKNVGNLLNSAGVSWGWFYGDFLPLGTSTNGVATCVAQYNPHYAPFNYYPSTANPHHLPPTSTAMIGQTDQANHNYDLSFFYQALMNGNLPAVTYLKFAANDTGHPRDSTPLLEQTSIVTAVNAIQQSPFWPNTAIIIAYDDSGGWYDHVAGPVINQSTDPINDAIIINTTTGAGSCASLGFVLPAGVPNDRCGFGVREPFLLISPFANKNYADHSLNDTTSILRFIEYNWSLGTIGDPQSFDVLASGSILGMFDFHPDDFNPANRILILDPSSGQPVP